MTTKKGSLADFAVQKPATAAAALADTHARAAAVADRQRGKGSMVSLTVRVSRDQWQRIHELALHEGRSINAVAIEGISRLFQEKGLKPL